MFSEENWKEIIFGSGIFHNKKITFFLRAFKLYTYCYYIALFGVWKV